jgi:hypothetical protein
MIQTRMFEPVRNKVTGDWRKFRNEALRNVYLSYNIIKMIMQENEMGTDSNKYGEEQKCI